ncbi:tripartite tricarboxylate transporter substrate-binding protein [Natronococcus sp. A-GB1]|uniref:Bug family tripartite tricarboxylate transporter substrate binding protein n=1 Tax=Natronococcus sp. A-GB1 TaxID=3037648 RepID=UPI00241DA39A|nr:tripartite tricarboxylate transporter substrate-binding protein [Natronococcus sp. A-GB1]MDG5761414.1 tripartite tricarboxylate transporter substrate-binding protein [Natronococcus sp. A-GB1]
MNRRNLLKGIGATSAISLSGLAGCLDDESGDGEFPSDSLTWMIPWSEGGGTDTYARQLEPLVSDALDEPIEIDNRAGAASLLGIEWLHGQDDDGYTFGTANTPSWQFAWRMEDVEAWEPTEFEPIAYFGVFGYTIIVNDDYDVEDYADLQDAYADGELENFAVQGVGHDSHVAAYLLRDDYDLAWDNVVPYDGGGEVNEAVISGEAPAGIATNTSAITAEESGNVSAVVSLMDTELDAFPEIDQITDYGDSMAYLTEFRQTQIAPPETPEDVREELEAATEHAATHEEAEEWAEETGNVLEFGDMDDAAADMEGALEELEENIDFEEFQQQIEDDE